jgi:integrase
MRAGEIAGLTAETVDADRRVAHLPRTKNGEPRDVPLSKEAIRLLGLLPSNEPLFGFHSGPLLSNNWYMLKRKTAVDGLRAKRVMSSRSGMVGSSGNSAGG